jgi:hypothetical protein
LADLVPTYAQAEQKFAELTSSKAAHVATGKEYDLFDEDDTKLEAGTGERQNFTTGLRLADAKMAAQVPPTPLTEQLDAYEIDGDDDDDDDEEDQYDHDRTAPAYAYHRPSIAPKIFGDPQIKPQTNTPTEQRVGKVGEGGRQAAQTTTLQQKGYTSREPDVGSRSAERTASTSYALLDELAEPIPNKPSRSNEDLRSSTPMTARQQLRSGATPRPPAEQYDISGGSDDDDDEEIRDDHERTGPKYVYQHPENPHNMIDTLVQHGRRGDRRADGAAYRHENDEGNDDENGIGSPIRLQSVQALPEHDVSYASSGGWQNRPAGDDDDNMVQCTLSDLKERIRINVIVRLASNTGPDMELCSYTLSPAWLREVEFPLGRSMEASACAIKTRLQHPCCYCRQPIWWWPEGPPCQGCGQRCHLACGTACGTCFLWLCIRDYLDHDCTEGDRFDLGILQPGCRTHRSGSRFAGYALAPPPKLREVYISSYGSGENWRPQVANSWAETVTGSLMLRLNGFLIFWACRAPNFFTLAVCVLSLALRSVAAFRLHLIACTMAAWVQGGPSRF